MAMAKDGGYSAVSALAQTPFTLTPAKLGCGFAWPHWAASCWIGQLLAKDQDLAMSRWWRQAATQATCEWLQHSKVFGFQPRH